MRLAALDLGSNSFHALIADVARGVGLSVIERAKRMPRIGEAIFRTGRFSGATLESALHAVGELIPVIERHRSAQPTGSVLVVEDDPASRELVVRMLQKEGIAVLEASNGKEALETLQNGPAPDLIILDLLMAEMDGFEFLREVRPHPQWSRIPVVVVSSLDLNNEAQQVLKGQVEHIFQKGRFAREDLLREVRETINQHMLKQQTGSGEPTPSHS